jgi:hypothetical protein
MGDIDIDIDIDIGVRVLEGCEYDMIDIYRYFRGRLC